MLFDLNSLLCLFLLDVRENKSHLQDLPNTGLLVSLNQCVETSANLEIIDISKPGRTNKVYSFEEVSGGKSTNDSTRSRL